MIRGLETRSAFRYVPLLRGTKRPVSSYVQTQGETLEVLRQRYPLANYQYALLLQTTDLVVVDLDVKANPNIVEEFNSWRKRVGLHEAFAKTLLVRTPSGGFHFYFRLPKSRPIHSRWINALAHHGVRGVDVLSSGLLLIPGCEVDGKGYEVVGSEGRAQSLDEIPELPEKILDWISEGYSEEERKFRPSSSAPTETDRKLQQMGLLDLNRVEAFLRSRQVRFQRSRGQIKLCCLYHDDKNPSASITVVDNRLFYHCFACSPNDRTLYARFVREYMHWAAEQRTKGKRIFNLQELAEALEKRPPRKTLLGHLLEEGTVTVLGGYQKDFKSTLARNIAARMSCGKPLGEWHVARGKVLFVPFEESIGQFLPRLTQLKPCYENIMCVPREDLEGGMSLLDLQGIDPIEMLDRWCAETQPNLVVIDTGWNFFSQIMDYRRYAMLGNLEVNRIFDDLKQVATRHHLAILLIWHVRKHADMGRGSITEAFQKMKDALSGVRGLASAADSVWFLRRKHQKGDEDEIGEIAEVEFFAEGRHPRVFAKWQIHEETGILLDGNIPLPEKVDAPATSKPAPAEPPITLEEVLREGEEDLRDLLEETEQADDTHEEEEPMITITHETQTTPEFESMGWYVFQEQPTSESVVLLTRPSNKEPADLYYTAIALGSRRERGVYGATLNCIARRDSVFGKMLYNQVPTIFFDIEATHINPEHGRVLAIGYCYRQNGALEADSYVLDFMTDEDERRILMAFNELLWEKAPYWIVGYNLFNFDLPYLFKRAEKLGIKLDYFEAHYRKRENVKFRYGSSHVETDIWLPHKDPRHAIVDLYLLVLRADANMGGLLESRSLYDVYAFFTGETVPDFGDKSKMHEWENEAVADLVETDVAATRILSDYLLPIEFSLASYIYHPFGEMIYMGQGTRMQMILLQDYISRGRAIRKQSLPYYQVEGAISRLEHTGVFRNVKKIDVVSLYPSIIIEENIAPLNDYDKRLPTILRELRDERIALKNRKDDPIAQVHQKALKVIINSAYGFMGASNFSFSDHKAAARVTEKGREVLQLMERVLKEHGCIPIELDTDGIIYQENPERDTSESVLKALHNQTPFQYEIDSYEAGLFVGAKNYVLKEHGGKMVFKGASLRSRRDPLYFRQVIRDLCVALLDGKPVDGLLQRALEGIRDVDVEMLISRQKATEKTKMTDGTSPRVGDTIYVWWSRKADGEQRTLEKPSAEELDYARYEEKLLSAIARLECVPEVAHFLKRYQSAGQESLDF